jgi:methyl-accepting chemotaxis protein
MDMNQQVATIIAAMQRVSMISSDTKTGMEEITIGINEIYKAAEAISESGADNSRSVDNLKTLIARFTVNP